MDAEKHVRNRMVKYGAGGGLYRGITVPIKVLDIVIAVGLVSLAATIILFGLGGGFTVTLDPAGGICETDHARVSYGEAYGELPEPVRDGFVFAGWELRGIIVDSDTVVTANGNHTLTAVWNEEN